ncbi:MAG: hypothetical protein K2Q33_01935 [Gammaproteobacteria bacterium]|nr:hypothetical protein [Gammaproteobacteria bacterium]
MKEKFEIRGYWFLPSNPENRVAGTLHFIPNEKIYLDLIGSFEDRDEVLSPNRNNQTDVIHGEGNNAEKITLLNCYGYGSINFDSSFAMKSYSVDYVLNGIHLSTQEDNQFNRIEASLPLLTSWVNHYALSYSIPYDEDGKRPIGFEIGYTTKNANCIEAEIYDQTTLELEYSCSPPGTHYEEVLEIKQKYLLNIKTVAPTSFMELLEYAYRFKSFLCLASKKEVDFNLITLFSPTKYQELNDGRKIFLPIRVYFVQQAIKDPKNVFRSFLFHHDDVEVNFAKIIQKWYSYDHQMLPIINHMIDSIQEKTVFKSGDYLVVVQALEGFHTRFRENTINKTRITLTDRLTFLYDEFCFVPIINNSKFDMGIIADTRHYYSHFFHKDAKEYIYEGEELFHCTKYLQKLLICCLLKETGLSNDQITKSIK